MPHRHSNRYKKVARALVTTDNVVRAPSYVFGADRVNKVPKMPDEEKLEVLSIIEQRYDSAREVTDAIAIKMEQWEKQYSAQFRDPIAALDEEKIYLPKTREEVQIAYSYILQLVSQLNPLVIMQPMVSSIAASEEEYRRAKVAEAMVNFHFNDLWKIRDDVFPKWLKTFLKFSGAIWKICYHEDSFLPDLRLEVKDRALQYIDPDARDAKDARWWIEKYYLPRHEVIQRIREGYWHTAQEYETISSGYDQMDDPVRRRYYHENYTAHSTVTEDDLIEIWDYWQAPRQGLEDVYAVIIGGEGGELVRYGRNPYPYKGIPYRMKSFDPHEFRVDGTGLVEMYRPFQEIINNFLNMRISDVRKNIIRPVAATGQFINAQTQQDFRDGNKIVRLSEDVLEASKDPGFDLRKHFVELPFQPSTDALLVQDLPFILGQGKENTHQSDVFRGQAPPHQATLGQIQEQLSRNQGYYRPILLQVMRGFEELAEICMEYFKSPEFFPAERIVQIIGSNKYADVIQDWHNPGGNMYVRSVSPDEMDVDVTIDAVQSADALASRTFLMTSLEQIFQSIGQIPELYQELKQKLDFVRIAEIMMQVPGVDIDAIRLSPEREKQKAQEQQQQQMQAMEMQKQMLAMDAQVKGLAEQIKQQARAEGQIAIDAHKAAVTQVQERERISADVDGKIDLLMIEIRETLKAELTKMREEAKLEKEAIKAQADADKEVGAVSVGHGNNVNK